MDDYFYRVLDHESYYDATLRLFDIFERNPDPGMLEVLLDRFQQSNNIRPNNIDQMRDMIEYPEKYDI